VEEARPTQRRPRAGVWSRKISKDFQRRPIGEAFEAGSVVVIDEAFEEGVPISVGGERAVGGTALGLAADGVRNSAVEALDQTIGLRPIRSGQAVLDTACCAEAVERMAAGRFVLGLVFHVDGEAVGELAAIVGEDGVNGMREVRQEAFKESRRSIGIAAGMDLQVNVAGGTVDRDEGVTFVPLQRRQMLQVDVNEPDGCLLEDADSRLGRFGSLAQAVTLQAAMDGAARELAIDAASHHLDDVVQRQLQFGSQFAHQRLFHR
jgi:hypothetical protein